jgi:hypothetical protein
MSKHTYEKTLSFNKEELHTIGYTVIPNVIDVPIEVVENLTKQIQIRDGDNKKQCNLSRRAKYVDRFAAQITNCITSLIYHPRYIKSNWTILQQKTDGNYNLSDLKSLPNDEFPLEILCALTSTDVRSANLASVEPKVRSANLVTLNPGDLMIIRCDFTHTYNTDNVILHCYMDNTSVSRIITA